MSVRNPYRSFRKTEDGNATIEFVILFPAFIFLFLTGFEAGYYMVRNVMLERAVDVVVRDVRLGNSINPNGNGNVPGHAAIKKRICDEAQIIPDCMRSIKVAMRPVPNQPGAVPAAVGGPIQCRDKSAPPGANQDAMYDVGLQNELMIIRVCALSKPLFPTTGIGVGMKVDTKGNYAIVAATAFVNEPGARVTGNGGTGSTGSGGTGGNGNGNGNGAGGI